MKKNIFISLLLLQSLAQAQTIEPLLGHFTSPFGIHIQVRSGGCTWKQQFHVEKEMVGETQRITFVREVEDGCRAYLPYGTILTFSFAELGLTEGAQFEIVNPRSRSRVAEF